MLRWHLNVNGTIIEMTHMPTWACAVGLHMSYKSFQLISHFNYSGAPKVLSKFVTLRASRRGAWRLRLGYSEGLLCNMPWVNGPVTFFSFEVLPNVLEEAESLRGNLELRSFKAKRIGGFDF